jgi:hypothetical protein
MPGTASEQQPICWSHTRDLLLRTCARRYYYRYHLANGGWRAGAPPEVRRAYVLAQLTTLDLVLGTAIHTRAREVATAIVTRRPRPTAELLLARTRAALNRVWKASRDLAAFHRDPRCHPVLLDVYYGREVDPESIERVRTKMKRCLAALVDCPVWTVLEGCTPAEVWIIDAPVQITVDGVLVWIVPDLVYARAGKRTVVLDWKTGRVDEATVLDQLCLGALAVRDALAVPAGRDGYQGLVVELTTGEVHSTDLSEDDLASAEERIRWGGEAMRALDSGPGGDPRDRIDDFPMTDQRAGCPKCPFWELCGPAIDGCSTSTTGGGEIGRATRSLPPFPAS